MEHKRKTLRGLLVDGIITKDEYQQDIVEINTEISELYARNNEQQHSMADSIQAIISASEAFKTGKPENKRKALMNIESKLVWDEENLYISSPEWISVIRNGLQKAKSKCSQFEPEKDIDFTDQNGEMHIAFLILCSTLENLRNYLERKGNIYD